MLYSVEVKREEYLYIEVNADTKKEAENIAEEIFNSDMSLCFESAKDTITFNAEEMD